MEVEAGAVLLSQPEGRAVAGGSDTAGVKVAERATDAQESERFTYFPPSHR